MNTLITVNNLTKSYAGHNALNQINFSIERGRIIGLLGPNGSGKTTLIKIIAGLLTPTSGSVSINGLAPGTETKRFISYLPDKNYLNNWMSVDELIQFFSDFYSDFQAAKAYDMLNRLQINPKDRLKSMSKGTKEKVQLILVMSRQADLYLLDEPIGGVDPAARDYILNTIITNYSENASIILSTHLISDIENILDDVIMIQNGSVMLASSVENIRSEQKKSIDTLFREVFKC
jgi:ABC-2 type transport system ATP-binding protein